MADIRLICVREDVALAEALAEAFDAAGYSIDETPSDPGLDAAGAGVLLWSQAAIKTPAFRNAAQGAIDSGKAVIANFTGSRLPPVVRTSPVFDLKGWDGDPDDPRLDALSHAVENLVSATPAETVAPASSPVRMPAQPVSPREELAYADEAVKAEAEETAEDASDLSHIRVETPAARSRAVASMLAAVVVLGAGLATAGYYGRHLIMPTFARFINAITPRSAPRPAPEIAPETATVPLPRNFTPIETLPTPNTTLATPSGTPTAFTAIPTATATTSHPPPPVVHHTPPRRHTPPAHTTMRPRTLHTQPSTHQRTPPPVTSWDRHAPASAPPKPSAGGPPE